jgi:hypothetical protein
VALGKTSIANSKERWVARFEKHTPMTEPLASTERKNARIRDFIVLDETYIFQGTIVTQCNGLLEFYNPRKADRLVMAH